MFDIGASELLLIVVVAIVVIGPKDLPLAMRTAGRWIGKIRRISNHFRAGLETMIREAELEEMEKKWQQQNKRIMEQTPAETQAPADAQNPADEVSAMAAGAGLPPEMPDVPKPPSQSGAARPSDTASDSDGSVRGEEQPSAPAGPSVER